MSVSSRKFLTLALLAGVVGAAFPAVPVRAAPVAEWTDATTGHRVVRISRDANSTSLYFTQNAFTPQGDAMVINTPDGIGVVSLKDWSLRLLVPGKGLVVLFAGRKTRSVYYASRPRDDAGGSFEVFAADIDTGRSRRVAVVPGGSIGSINADETLLLGQVTLAPGTVNPDGTLREAGHQDNHRPGMNLYAENRADGTPYSYAEAKERAMHRRLKAALPMEIFTIDLRSGARKVVVASRDWLNHVQFSPTDPMQIMYCHEGPWHEVDRIWIVRADGTGRQPVHQRRMNMEIAGHEFFAPDGKTIWYDLQTPRGEVFWLASYDIATGKRRWYKVDRNQASVHFNLSPDGTRFSGDGSDAEMVAHAPNAKYLYLFTPRRIADVADLRAEGADALIDPGTLEQEQLVDMRRQNYKLEPNMMFTPDGKWIVFRGNMEGVTHIYAVEVARSTPR